MAASEQLTAFIGDTFRSVWALELLLLLKKSGDRPCPIPELVRELRASEHVVTTFGESLVAAGLLVADSEGAYSYRPAGKALARLADETEIIYAKRPDAVRRIIVSASSRDIEAFADAFRLRKE